jgi:hypothetical protein
MGPPKFKDAVLEISENREIENKLRLPLKKLSGPMIIDFV